MYRPREISSRPDWLDEDGIKLYCISARSEPVLMQSYFPCLAMLKQSRDVPWRDTAAFAIFHDGASARYLVLAYWGNDNELFTLVAVDSGAGWEVAPDKYSFCLWDLEVIWQERALYIEHLYNGCPDLAAYRQARSGQTQTP